MTGRAQHSRGDWGEKGSRGRKKIHRLVPLDDAKAKFRILHRSLLGFETEFRSGKIPQNRLGTVSVIPRKKALIPRHSEFHGRANSEARNGTERKGIPRKKLVLQNSSKIT
jgi:hypothetical protein